MLSSLLGVVSEGNENKWHHASGHDRPEPDSILEMIKKVEQHISIARFDFELLQ